MLQISCSGEFRKNMGRLTITFMNKTPYAFQNFQSDSIRSNEIKVNVVPSETLLSPHGQIQQFINLECAQDFSDVPSLSLQYM